MSPENNYAKATGKLASIRVTQSVCKLLLTQVKRMTISRQFTGYGVVNNHETTQTFAQGLGRHLTTVAFAWQDQQGLSKAEINN